MVRGCIELIKISLERIEPGYFKLTTTYEPSGIVRERVFCYELYHQIRSNLRADHLLTLNGEIDKRGHIDFDPQDRKNPDFVFHVPGTHSWNTLIVQVKGTLEYREEIIEDFRTILKFIGRYQYKAGVFILYNHSFAELLMVVGDELRSMASNPFAPSVYILAIKEHGGPCEEIVLAGLGG